MSIGECGVCGELVEVERDNLFDAINENGDVVTDVICRECQKGEVDHGEQVSVSVFDS